MTVPSNRPNQPHPAGGGGSLIGNYNVIRKIGEGGMGSVYLAEDAKLGRKVAIKTMKPELAANKLDRERFLREARTAAAIEHDNIVPIWGVGETTDGTPFIAMPFLQGETLDSRLKREPVAPLDLLLKVTSEVADGLAAAHAKGLIHRDIKPGNIWLEGDLTSPNPARQLRRCKILDFGLARSVDKQDAQITASGAILGTPAYMAPEQAKGERVDHRADLFSLGATLYRMASGRLPFDGPTPMAVLIALTTEMPPPVGTVAPHLPSDLAALIDRLMSKDPANRPQSAVEVVDAVQRIANHVNTSRVTCTTPVAITPLLPLSDAQMPPLELEQRGIISTSTPQLLAEETGVPHTVAPRNVRHKRMRLAWLIAAAVCVLVLLPTGLWLGGAFGKRKRVDEFATNDVLPKKEEPPKLAPPKPDPPMPVLNANRAAAEWVLSVQGCININYADRVITDAGELPRESFQLTQIRLLENTPVTDAAFAVFKNCKHLTHIALNNTTIGDAGLANFAGCKQLMYLYLRGSRVTSTGIAFIKDCPELLELDLNSTPVNDAGLEHIKHCRKLGHLYLQGAAVTEQGVLDLAKSLPDCQIEWNGGVIKPGTVRAADRAAAEWVLAMKGTVRVNGEADAIKSEKDLPKEPFRLTDVYLTTAVKDVDLAVFKDCKNLTTLYLVGTGIGNGGLAHFSGCKNLTTLNLSGTKVTDDAVATIKQFTKLTDLVIGETAISDEAAREIASTLPSCRIQHNGGTIEPKPHLDAERKAAEYVLSVGGSVYVNHKFHLINNVRNLPNEPFKLTGIHLLNNVKVTDADLVVFKDCHNLETVDLVQTSITDAGLAHFKHCNSIKQLVLADMKISDKALAYFKNCKALFAIDLANTQVSGAGLAHFENVLILSLQGTDVHDENLSQLKRFQGLLMLNLSSTKISDAGLVHLKSCKNVQTLDLSKTEISDKGLDDINQLSGLISLKLEKTKVTEKKVTELAKVLPQCKIIWDGGTIEPKEK